MTSAQDEFNELFREKGRRTGHPEDDSDNDNHHHNNNRERETFFEKDSDAGDDEDDTHPSSSANTSKMRSRYYLPKLRSEANTGPKGVIADAQAFEAAKRNAHKLPFMSSGKKEARTTPPPSSLDNNDKGGSFLDGERSSDDEDAFLARWRANRLKELSRSRNSSPANRRRYGSLLTVDAEGFLDAIEKVQRDTIVVVFIYDDMSDISDMVEDSLRLLARRHSTTRFVKLHYEEAEMEVAGVPAIIAYRGGEKFAGLVPLVDEMPDDAGLDPAGLEHVLKR
ncbi:thioredoxin-like protein [Lineolata rhizophorae]|uniref:Thioredoxin-like protein n=1 Tax=Lineolata rhizophorae TaxID=578093 RepID=A0A6A6NNA3_9PEZI|nr:thioredoxin-like protein [Lineolata rhizophorae]